MEQAYSYRLPLIGCLLRTIECRPYNRYFFRLCPGKISCIFGGVQTLCSTVVPPWMGQEELYSCQVHRHSVVVVVGKVARMENAQSGLLAAHIDRVLHGSQAETDADLPWVVLLVCNCVGNTLCWFATNPDLPGCVGHGATESEALEQLRLARRDYLFVLYEEGMPCPTRRSMEDLLSCWV